MKKLSNEQYNRAKTFMKTQAADIDLAMFEFFFEDKPIESVLQILYRYQDECGGFSKLEYDMEYPLVCLKHTESACRYILRLSNIKDNEEMVVKLINYLLKNYKKENGMFENILLPEVNDYPCAPWWSYEENHRPYPKNRDELISMYEPNTNATLMAAIIKYKNLVDDDVYNAIKSIPIDKIKMNHQFYHYDMVSNIFFINELKKDEKDELLAVLMDNRKLADILDDWDTEQSVKFFHYIDSIDHPYCSMYNDEIEENIEFAIDAQNSDGSWSPSWSWGDVKTWKRVQKRISGSITFQILLGLKKFNCIEF